MQPAETIRTKRDGGVLGGAQIDDFVHGLVDGRWADSQTAALAMAILLRGMDAAETVALTKAMMQSGTVLDWRDAAFAGPVLDKHSTGGVGDKVSLLLAPMLAACGAVVPMISGRGLGHTGGTLDKLEALPGYTVDVSPARLLATLRTAGCAIVGASADLAPADRRLYALRDLTATVESLPLITASILSKKLAAGLQGLVLDVKVGSGAFMATLPQAQALAHSLVDVARGAGLPARALITDMNQVLGTSAGNALEVQESIDFLCGRAQEPRLLELSLQLVAELLQLGGLAADVPQGRQQALRVLASGAAAESFARMVAQLGGPADVLRDAQLAPAPVVKPVLAARDGVIAGTDVRAVGMAVVALGGGRSHAGQRVDPRVGVVGLLAPGSTLQRGQPLAHVHAASAADAEQATQALLAALVLVDTVDAKQHPVAPPIVLERVGG